MKLESEFQLYLQRRQLEQALSADGDLARSSWVRLVQPLSAVSADQALLLCPASEHQWVAWIPDYGEVLLDTDQFYGTA
ncbi:hypothetical protein ACN4EK_15240 [Pantanalinema rosaneae CENA516]|uniref:hypothetical protein n=1 Tax=Pantanalinema rosaneae TaxID=1620701 RepID=UPI003D6DEEFD